MWRSDDGTLPNHDTQLARSGGVGPNNWWRVWPAIKHLFDTDGDRVTNTDLQAELGKANALLVTKRAVAALGGQATQFRRTIQREPLEKTLTPPKPLKSLNGVQASAQANYNYNLKKEKEPLPLPRKGEASGSEARGGNLSANPSLPSLEENQKASTEVPVKLSHSESPLESALQNWGAAFRKRNG
jgi:uncharacterized protein YdaU (DUF1376 family)